MKNKYNINETVSLIGKQEKLTVVDFEFINGFYLYYFDGKVAYPENQLSKIDNSLTKEKFLDTISKIDLFKLFDIE